MRQFCHFIYHTDIITLPILSVAPRYRIYHFIILAVFWPLLVLPFFRFPDLSHPKHLPFRHIVTANGFTVLPLLPLSAPNAFTICNILAPYRLYRCGIFHFHAPTGFPF